MTSLLTFIGRLAVPTFAVFVVAGSMAIRPVAAQLRIVDYNTGSQARPGLDTIFAAIGAESVNGIAKPADIITLQEQASSASTTQGIVDVLNSVFGAGVYARATLDGATSGAGRPGLIYNTQTVSLLSQAAIGTISASGNARQTLRYELRPVGYDAAANFVVYSSHYKASNGSSDAARRAVEAASVRADADALGTGAHVIYAGDFNVYANTESMWTTLTGPGAGQAFDPIAREGRWSNNAAFRDVHTQSPVTTARYSGQITGGMDDRFDFQMVTEAFLDGQGLSYIPGSYRAFGNTGTHALNGELGSGNSALFASRLPGYSTTQARDVLEAISGASDHLPVIADYQVPARQEVIVTAAPAAILAGASAGIDFTVANSAPVVAVNGADTLTYTYSSNGSLDGTGGGTDAALGTANAHRLNLQSTTVGAQTGNLQVTSGSQAVANGSFAKTFDYAVLDHASPTLADGNGQPLTASTFDLSATSSIGLSVLNAIGTRGFTAALDLDLILATGDVGEFALTLVPTNRIAAGDFVAFQAAFLGTAPGIYSASYELRFSDEDLPGAIDLAPLNLTFSANVVPEPSTAILLLFALGAVAARGIWSRRAITDPRPLPGRNT